ncbi:hypothetical protein LTR50_006686 [Elasticomyces elasticus]|nr:hypothetical protein LTR50_006686 [Elasticomyces elasticus]
MHRLLFLPLIHLPLILPLLLLPLPTLSHPHPSLLTTDHIAVQQTLSRYALAIDSKDFAALAAVFTADAVADYSTGIGVLRGLGEIEVVLAASLANVSSQHGLTTQLIDVYANATASTTTYFTATHFSLAHSQPPTSTSTNSGVLYLYGKYLDRLVKTADEGMWRIHSRRLVFIGPFVGDLSVFGG